MNYRTKSSDAILLDSIALNIVGYWSYFATIYLQLFNGKVIKDYEKVYNTKPILLMIDFLYASHCLICIIVTFCQVIYYRVLKLKSYHEKGPSKDHFSFSTDFHYVAVILRKLNRSTKFLILVLVCFLCGCFYQAFVSESLPLLHLTKILTLVKLFVNCIKYVPQLLLNYKKKSVEGYPFVSVYLDLAGGTMSLCQIILDNYIILLRWKLERPINRLGVELDHSLHFSFIEFVKKNFAKCGLVLVGFFFDFCFLSQRRMYAQKTKRQLLPSGGQTVPYPKLERGDLDSPNV